MDIEKLHAKALEGVIELLKENQGVVALVPEHVFGPGEEAKADEWARCVIVRQGRNHGKPATDAKNILVQRDAKIEVRGESKDVFTMLMNAVVKALNGKLGKHGFKQAVHTHSGNPDDVNGHWSRIDTFGLFCELGDDEPEAPAIAPPARKVPIAPPPAKKSAKPTE